MRKILLTSICVLLFSQVSFAENNVAVVDLQKVVNNSYQVKTLKQEHTNKMKELNGIISKAQAEIAKESDIKKIVEIQDKYTNEFNNKKDEIDKMYASKLSVIEDRIRADVESKAKSDGYDMVLAKSVALYGGKDITSEIVQMVNNKK